MSLLLFVFAPNSDIMNCIAILWSQKDHFMVKLFQICRTERKDSESCSGMIEQ